MDPETMRPTIALSIASAILAGAAVYKIAGLFVSLAAALPQ